MEKLSTTHYQIINELCDSLDHLGAGSGLISIFSSWGDTLTSIEVRDILMEFNSQSQCESHGHTSDVENDCLQNGSHQSLLHNS